MSVGMPVGSWRLYLRCAMCGETFERIVTEDMVTRRPSGGFAPLRCVECNAVAAEPTVRPWALSELEMRFLRQLKIQPV